MEKIKKLAIYGKSGHAKVIREIALLNGYNEFIFIDDDTSKKDVISYEYFKSLDLDIEVIIAIGNNVIREKIYQQLSEDDYAHALLIHPSAQISTSASISEGSVVMAGVIVNAEAKIGKAVILNSACIIEHDNQIEDFVHISPNVALAGDVKVKKSTHIGIGASVIQGVTIEENVIVGAGSVVIRDISKNQVVAGVPAKSIKKGK